jgi:quercetin dioxygenase-like cupin family protein
MQRSFDVVPTPRIAPLILAAMLISRTLAGQNPNSAGRADSTPVTRTVVPVYREPLHHLAYENPLVRVLDVRVPAGDTTLYHTHADLIVGAVITDARNTEELLGAPPLSAEPADTASVPGTILDNWDRTLPYTHRVINVDSVAFHYVIAELRAPSGIDAPVLPNTSTMQLVREGPLARVYRVILTPGESTGMHRHAQPGLTLQIGAGTLHFEGDPALASGGSGPGSWWWYGPGRAHAIQNSGTKPIEVVEIDWR